jgi:predicted O-linked N-acetylglucosamine transferase (SPINDLY family)
LTGDSKGERAADAQIARGQGHEDARELAAAEACFRQAVAAAPRYARAHLNLGNALHKQGRLEEAAQAHRAAIACDARHVGAHFNLGAVLLAAHQLGEAQAAFEQALRLDPALADAAVNLAAVRAQAGDAAGARRELERALAIAPDHAGARANLGSTLLEAGELDRARAAFTTVLASDPGNVVALAGIAHIEVLRGHAAAADPAYRAALAADPDDAQTWSAFLFSLNLRADLDEAAVAREHFAFGDRFAPAAAVHTLRRTGERVRVGYVSGDLGHHPVALFLRPALMRHDRTRFEIFCYSDLASEDDVTAQLRGHADHWRGIAGRGDAWVEARIREDRIDVLVDLSGHTARNRLPLFARRSAPVQATWLGYLNTTGLAAMDYRICDAYTDPPGATEAWNRERLMRLPHSQWCYLPYYEMPVPKRAPRAQGVVFASFNQFVKVSDAALDLWCEILHAVPDGRLRIYGVPRGVGRADFVPRVEQRGVAGARVELFGRLGIPDYFGAIADADMALDTLPYNGATTTLDTLWMGTPVIGLRGTRAISRGAYSILRAAGLGELTASTPAEYVQRNVALAADTDARARWRSGLRALLERSAVMDTVASTRDLEHCYLAMLEGLRA